MLRQRKQASVRNSLPVNIEKVRNEKMKRDEKARGTHFLLSIE